jgi:hypothetical protein
MRWQPSTEFTCQLRAARLRDMGSLASIQFTSGSARACVRHGLPQRQAYRASSKRSVTRAREDWNMSNKPWWDRDGLPGVYRRQLDGTYGRQFRRNDLVRGIRREVHAAIREVDMPRGIPKKKRPQCGARCRTRFGEPCRAAVVWDRERGLMSRCRMHGGLSTGPKTPEGRARCAAAARARWARWRAEREAERVQRTVSPVPSSKATADPADSGAGVGQQRGPRAAP